MCGIWAVFGKETDANPDQYAKCLKYLNARGPEQATLMPCENIGVLGFTRLAINGLNEQGMQPMTADGVMWAVNGEIYNWRELAAKGGIECTSGSDCEVIGKLYRKVGGFDGLASMFRSIDGVFACVIVDTVANRIIVARDPYGVRPLFVGKTFTGKGLRLFFGSEMKSLVEVADEIAPFAPGTFQVYDATSLKCLNSEKYHVISTLTLPVFNPKSDFGLVTSMIAVRDALCAAVKKRMMTERPVAALLSGGLDSSLIAALVSKELKLAGAPPLKTFSIGMEGSSDIACARKVAAWIGSDHTEVLVTADEMFDAIREVVQTIESYDTTTVRASVGNWLVSREISRRTDCKVVFNGDGSDEVFGSYLYCFGAPSDGAYEEEVLKLLKNIHTFDVLRSDRSISSNGLEPRTPFLDKAFVQTVLSIPVEFRRPVEGRIPEKWLLRRAFDDGVTLPREILWRRKEAFSDGVSGTEKSWYQQIQEKVVPLIREDWKSVAQEMFPVNTPLTAEMYMYRLFYEQRYTNKNVTATVPFFWMPNWSDATDPSARTLPLYQVLL